jgi:hypothetical protein
MGEGGGNCNSHRRKQRNSDQAWEFDQGLNGRPISMRVGFPWDLGPLGSKKRKRTLQRMLAVVCVEIMGCRWGWLADRYSCYAYAHALAL